MKLKLITWSLLIMFSTFGWMSCKKETPEQLSLVNIENNTTKLYYGSNGGVTIIGGDGKYAFSCESPLLKAEMTYRNYILFEPLGVGDAVVTIKDSSGNSYILNVTVAYKSESIVVSKVDAIVVGDNMTVGSQKELKEKAITTIPVKAEGGYKFVYTAGEDLDKTNGIVFIYPDKYGNNGIEGTFERVLTKSDDGKSYSHVTYSLHYKNINHTFTRWFSKPTGQSSENQPGQLAEDLTAPYKTAYPELEQVYTSQIIGSTAVE